MDYCEYAMNEFKAAGWLNEDGSFKDEQQKQMCDHILTLLKVFSDEGHSGASASYARNLFNKLSSFQPLSPLTGEGDEWDESGQNKRCFSVFREKDGKVFDLDGRIFRNSRGMCYRTRESSVLVTFPYTPVSEQVEVL